MSSLYENLDFDLNVDTVLEQYMQDLESCTTDLSQAPPTLPNEQLSSFIDGHQTDPDRAAELCDVLQPGAEQASSLLEFEQDPLIPKELQQAADLASGASTGVKRTDAWVAKNRRAQRRFRERQKVCSAESSVFTSSYVLLPFVFVRSVALRCVELW